MLTGKERMLMWGAALVIGACGMTGVWKVSQEPKVDPRVVAIAKEIQADRKKINKPAPPPVPDGRLDRWTRVITANPGAKDAVPPSQPRFAYVEVIPTVRTVKVLPTLTYNVKEDLDGAALAWSLQDVKVEPGPYEKIVKGEVLAFVIDRRTPGMEFAELVRFGPEVRSYRDVDAKPLETYFYRVRLVGKETDRKDDYKEKTVTKGPDEAVEARLPSNQRVRLLGGDKTLAIFHVETYHRQGKKWQPRTVQAAPGKAVPGTGWKLEGLRFDKSTLVADVTDDTGARRELKTKP